MDFHLDLSSSGFITSHADTLGKNPSDQPPAPLSQPDSLPLHTLTQKAQHIYFSNPLRLVLALIVNEAADNGLQRAGGGRDLCGLVCSSVAGTQDELQGPVVTLYC